MNYGQPDVFFLHNGYDLGQHFTAFTPPNPTAKTEQTDGFGDAWEEHSYTGVRSWEYSGQGIYDDNASGPHAALGNTSHLGTTGVACFGVESTASGAEFLGMAGLQVDYARSPERAALTKFAFSAKGTGRLDQGLIVHPLAGRAASGNTTGAAIDFGGSATGGAAAYLQVQSFSSGSGATGASGIVIDVLHSADNLTFSSYGSFSASAAPLAQRVVSTAPIQRYRAVQWQGASGAGAPSTCTFFVGVCNLGSTA